VMSLRAKLETEGFAWVRGALSDNVLKELDLALEMESKAGHRLSPESELAKALHENVTLRGIAEDIECLPYPVRIVAFDKSQDANWALPWHQDRVIAVREKIDFPGYELWTRKSDIWHCEPPISLLEDMFFMRIHLDDSDINNGCLELAPATHKLGKIAAGAARDIAEKSGPFLCPARRGDILLVSALTLHKSSVSSCTATRRAIRVDYSSQNLPMPLNWAFA